MLKPPCTVGDTVTITGEAYTGKQMVVDDVFLFYVRGQPNEWVATGHVINKSGTAGKRSAVSYWDINRGK